MLFHAPYQLFTASLQPHELSTGTSAFFLVRFTGATVGLVRKWPITPLVYMLTTRTSRPSRERSFKVAWLAHFPRRRTVKVSSLLASTNYMIYNLPMR